MAGETLQFSSDHSAQVDSGFSFDTPDVTDKGRVTISLSSSKCLIFSGHYEIESSQLPDKVGARKIPISERKKQRLGGRKDPRPQWKRVVRTRHAHVCPVLALE